MGSGQQLPNSPKGLASLRWQEAEQSVQDIMQLCFLC